MEKTGREPQKRKHRDGRKRRDVSGEAEHITERRGAADRTEWKRTTVWEETEEYKESR